ncbi:MAG: glycosyltransferase [Dysgonamonadaceae bacterium]|jgi:glycosyltransferase involved in cell wall biosynthesis|nr:glycosyltransferase [Dysgonamonadaceae bacterium]
MFVGKVDILVLTALFLCWIVQIVYYWVYLAKPYYYQRAVDKGRIRLHPATPLVSLIIYARNEAKNLEQYLPAILEQNYPQYEVIVVDDRSNDDTESILRRMSLRYKHFYYTYIPLEMKNISRKKLALTLGIKASHYDKLLFLEADSHPVSPDWLHLMARHFIGKKTIVLGFSALENQPSRYAVYDYFFSNLQMIVLALMHRACMGNGKNLGYSKSEFSRQRTFSDYSYMDAGDDDLLINELAGPDNVSVELTPDSITRVNIDEVWIWKELKVKRMITWSFYRKFSIVFWSIEKFSRILFYGLFIYALVWFFTHWLVIGVTVSLFLLRFLCQGLVINQTAKMLKLPKFHLNLLFFDFIQPFVNGYFYLYGIFQGRRKGFWRYGER